MQCRGDALAVALLAGDSLDVHDVFEEVGGDHFALILLLSHLITASSSFRMGFARTLCVSLSSFDNGVLMMVLRTLEGVEK
jgi:hypothetical protein